MSDYKLISFDKEAIAKLASGANTLSRAVVSTLGPLSANVAIDYEYPGPKILHDGVSVAEEIKLEDPFENLGAKLLREAASRTNDLAGDGTTTATLLANTLIQEGFKLVEGGVVDGVITGKINPILLREKLTSYVDLITHFLDQQAVKIDKKEDYQKVAVVSSASEEIGQLVADAIEKVGKDGVVLVEEESGFESRLELSEGMEFDNGFLSPYFVTDTDRAVCEYKDAYVLLTDHRIVDASLLVDIVSKVMEDNNKPLLIIADDVEGPALSALVLTTLKAKARLVAVVAPEYGERRKMMLDDIALLTGGEVISKDLGHNLKEVELKQLGRVKSLRVDANRTTFVPKNIDREEIKEREKVIREQIKQEKNTFKKTRLQERLAKLSQSIATIYIGGASNTEISDKKARAIDAVHATKAALSEGIIPGGGTALRDIANNLDRSSLPLHLTGQHDDLIFDLVLTALRAPFRTILTNSGIDNPDQYLGAKAGFGINVLADRQSVDMLKAGIVDPVKVTKLAIRHAFSAAGTMLTTKTIITDDPKLTRNIQLVRPV